MDASSDYAYALPTSPKSLYNLLKDLKIEFKIFEHPPLFTIPTRQKEKKLFGYRSRR